MFRVIQLFIFVIVFGRIVHRTIRIQPNSLKPLFGTSLISMLPAVKLYITGLLHVTWDQGSKHWQHSGGPKCI